MALKARQIGYSWLAIAKALWLMRFRACSVLLFSQTDLEAQELMRRLVEMWRRLPDWLRPEASGEPSKHELSLASGAQALAFATTARSGRSFTAGFVLVDEADFVTDLDALLNAVKPTVDMGGRLALVSTSNKSRESSLFKAVYLAAKAGKNNYAPVFHGWRARPGRTDEWYAAEERASLAETGALDRVYQEYPATDEEALAPAALDKRIASEWLRQCYVEVTPLADLPRGAPSVPGLMVYRLPVEGGIYVVGADPAAGNPTSHESAATVLDARTGEEVASFAGRFQPSTFAGHINEIGKWYGHACAMVEKNNHGWAVLLWLEQNGELPLLHGLDGQMGWTTSTKSKALMYEQVADTFRLKETIIHSFATLTQLQSIEGGSLKGPGGKGDDRAMGYGLAIVGVPRALMAVVNRRQGDSYIIT